MKTLGELIESKKCRTGEISGTTERGRYWLACDPIELRSHGNGFDEAEKTYTLHLSRYADGHAEAVIQKEYNDYRNEQHGKSDYLIPEVLKCTCAEDVEVELKKGIVYGYGLDGRDVTSVIYKEYSREGLFEALSDLGLPHCCPTF